MKKGLLILAVSLMTLLPQSAPAAVRGYVMVGPSFYGASYRPYWGPMYGGYYYANGSAGQVKLDTKVKDAQVFINGAFAGMTQQAKSMHLRPGSYRIEIRELGRTKFVEQIYVVAGKTLHLRPQL